MRIIALAMVTLALAGCAQQNRAANLTPEQRAVAIGALLNRWQPVQAYQQPFYPMRPIPVARPCCGYY
jgi:hypothetical protein